MTKVWIASEPYERSPLEFSVVQKSSLRTACKIALALCEITEKDLALKLASLPVAPYAPIADYMEVARYQLSPEDKQRLGVEADSLTLNEVYDIMDRHGEVESMGANALIRNAPLDASAWHESWQRVTEANQTDFELEMFQTSHTQRYRDLLAAVDASARDSFVISNFYIEMLMIWVNRLAAADESETLGPPIKGMIRALSEEGQDAINKRIAGKIVAFPAR